MTQTIDVTGLPESMVKEIEQHVVKLRNSLLGKPEIVTKKQSSEEWVKHFTAWVQSQRSTNPQFDDSRESIYEGRGE